MADLSIFKLDARTINIKDTTARQTADSAKTLATTASGNATTALNKINELEIEKADKTLATDSANGLMSAADKKAIDREFFRMLPKGGTYIPAKANLNSIQYLKIGNYYNSLNAETGTIKNVPANSAFMMYVLSPLSAVYDNESTTNWVYRLRIFIGYTGREIFTQQVVSDATVGNFSYGPWIKMTNSNDLSAVSKIINDHIANKSNPHGVTKAQVGLGNVDNTKDADKPISTAVQTALDKKADKTITTEALNKINELEKLSRVSISYDSTKENMTITIGTHSVA